jgi:hypothetical protein
MYQDSFRSVRVLYVCSLVSLSELYMSLGARVSPYASSFSCIRRSLETTSYCSSSFMNVCSESSMKPFTIFNFVESSSKRAQTVSAWFHHLFTALEALQRHYRAPLKKIATALCPPPPPRGRAQRPAHSSFSLRVNLPPPPHPLQSTHRPTPGDV